VIKNAVLPVTIIDEDSALGAAIARIAKTTVIGLDTEFRREDTYYPELCLLQIATHREIFLIDNLAIADLDPLLTLLANPRIVKVMHSARQDLELLMQLGGTPLQPVFDTQIAIGCLGYELQMGYSTLVQRFMDIAISKSQTRTQWCKRPLTRAQLDYAAEDVIFLLPVMEQLQRELEKSGRENWFIEDIQALYDRDLYEQDNDTAWQRVKAAGKLDAKQRARLKILAGWREEVAKKKNRPRQWIVKDTALIDLARQNPDRLENLDNIRDMPAGKIKRYATPILEILSRPIGQDIPAGNNVRTDQNGKGLLKKLKSIQQSRARELKVMPELLAGRRDLNALVRGDTDTRATRGWRRDVLGNDLLAAISDR